MKDYTLDEIFDEDLLFILPFYIFTHEARFPEYEADEAKLKTLQDELSTIVARLDALVEEGKLTEYQRATIMEMSRKVVDNLARRYRKVKEGARSIMGGQVLQYQAKTAYLQGIEEGKLAGIAEGEARGKRAGIAEGELKGKREGKREGVIATARQLLSMRVLTLQQIAQATGLSIPEIEALRGEGCQG